MAWTTPRTWVTSEVVTAAMMNAHVRDNMNIAVNSALGDSIVTANQTTISSEVDLTGLTASFTQPANAQMIRVSGSIRYGGTTADDVATLRIKEGATVLQVAEQCVSRPIANVNPVLAASVIIPSPSAGAHTYKLSLQRSVGTGDMTMTASTTHPAYILIESLGIV